VLLHRLGLARFVLDVDRDGHARFIRAKLASTLTLAMLSERTSVNVKGADDVPPVPSGITASAAAMLTLGGPIPS